MGGIGLASVACSEWIDVEPIDVGSANFSMDDGMPATAAEEELSVTASAKPS